MTKGTFMAPVLAEAKDKVIDVVTNASTNTELWIAVGSYLYKKVSERSPLSGTDLTHYRTMQNLYIEKTGNAKIPEHWELDDKNCPIHCSTFKEQMERLRHELPPFEKSQHGLKTQIIGMVAIIDRLFESLSKRSWLRRWKKYRPDGFESMFLNELAMWLVIDLPRYSLTDEKTVEMVRKRIEYCKQIEQTVLVFRSDNDVANPKNTLPSIISELQDLSEYLFEVYRAATFNDKALLIDGHIVDMLRGTFNILHLMLDEVDQQEFQVLGFLQPSEGRKQKNDLFKKSLLGQWIVQTCNVGGFSSNRYMNKRDISLELIDRHIDLDLSTLTEVQQIGCSKFVWKQTYGVDGYIKESDEAKAFLKTKAEAFLRQVIELHRSILRLAYIRKGLKTTIELNIAHGEIWLFAKNEGKTMFDGLKAALEDAIEHHIKVLNDFWDVYYTKTYAPFVAREHKDMNDKTYRDMMCASAFYDDNCNGSKDIKKLIAETNYHADQVVSRFEANQEAKRSLAKRLYDYLSKPKVYQYDETKLESLLSIMDASECEAEDPKIKTNNTQFIAAMRLCQAGGYNIANIPEDLLRDVSQYLIAQELDTSESELEKLKEKYDAAIEKAKADKQSKKESADEQTKKTYRKATVTLCQSGGYDVANIPLDLVEDVYQYLIMTPEMSEAEVKSRQEKYDAAIEVAKAHQLTKKDYSNDVDVANAKFIATFALCKQGGYSPDEIPPQLYEDAYRFFISTSKPGTAESEPELENLKVKYQAALEIAKQHKLTQEASSKEHAKLLATATLFNYGGYSQEEIPSQLYEDVYQYFILTQDTADPEFKSRQEKYEAAIEEAKQHKLTKTKGADMPQPTPTAEMIPSNDYLYKKESLSTALLLHELFSRTIKERSLEFTADKESSAEEKYFNKFKFTPLSALTSHSLQKRLQGIASLIYENILNPYSDIAESRFISIFSSFNKYDNWKLLQKHYSRMISALVIVAKSPDFYTSSPKAELELVNRYLIQGVVDMLTDLYWLKIKNAPSLMTAMLPERSKLLEERADGMIQIISPEIETAVARNERAQALEAAAKDRDLLSKAQAQVDEALRRADKASNDAIEARNDATQERAISAQERAISAQQRMKFEQDRTKFEQDREKFEQDREKFEQDRETFAATLLMVLESTNRMPQEGNSPNAIGASQLLAHRLGVFATGNTKPTHATDALEKEPGTSYH